MGKASGLNNQGIMHAVFQYGGRPLCGSKRALMGTVIEKFREYPHQCKRCAAKLVDMDARAEAKGDGRKVIGFIDITPTWASLIPTFIALIENGDAKGRAVAIEEMTRMAQIADAHVAQSKARAA